MTQSKNTESIPADAVAFSGASAVLAKYGQSPRKVRLVCDLVKGKQVTDALAELSFLHKRAALPIAKLIHSAAKNAEQKGGVIEDLRIENITVDSAGMLRRLRARAFGRGATIRHRKSRIVVTVS